MIPEAMPILVFVEIESSVDEGDPVHDYMNVGDGGVVNTIDNLVSGCIVVYRELSDVIQGLRRNVFHFIGEKRDDHVTHIVE